MTTVTGLPGPPAIERIRVPPGPQLRAIVVVPARDEAETLGPCLRGLLRQQDGRGGPLSGDSYEIILLLNNCVDQSGAVARAVVAAETRRQSGCLPAVHIVEALLPPAQAHVGTARRWAMGEARDRFARLGRPDGIIASTDADTVVDRRWLAATIAEIARGAEAVGGRLLLSAAAWRRLSPELRRLASLHRRHERLIDGMALGLDPDRYDPWPRHTDHGGASLAVTAAAYDRVGGLPPLPSGEDAALYRALRRHDARFRHSPTVRVHTSERLIGRAAGGMAATLTQWQKLLAADQPILVADPRAAARTAERRASLRALWQGYRGLIDTPVAAQRNADRLGLDHVQWRALAETSSCGAFLDHLQDYGDGIRLLPLPEAWAALSDRFPSGASTLSL